MGDGGKDKNFNFSSGSNEPNCGYRLAVIELK
jgi:hypothetical protein